MRAAAPTDLLCSVLLVEDDHDSREVMGRLLRQAGCEVRVAMSVGDALLELEHWLPSHILLDLMLPDAGGVVLLRSVRRRGLPIRIAIVTGAGPDSAAVANAMDYDPDAVFHKPVNFNELRAWLEAD